MGGQDPPDRAMIADFRREVGWTTTGPARLFDIGVPAVQRALAVRTTPPANYEITVNNWNSPQWVEQPMTDYSVAGGPGEDFAESVMAFVHEPQVLLSRSPRRYHFLFNRKERWLPGLRRLPTPGDYPEPRKNSRFA